MTPLPSSSAGGRQGRVKGTVFTASPPPPTVPQCAWDSPLPLGQLLCLPVPSTYAPSGSSSQTLLFPLPTSQLCESLCPNILSILIKGETCLSFLCLSRLKRKSSRVKLWLTHHVLCKHGTQPAMPAKLKLSAASLWVSSSSRAILTAQEQPILTLRDSYEYRYHLQRSFTILYVILSQKPREGQSKSYPHFMV